MDERRRMSTVERRRPAKQVLDELRDATRFVLVTHEHPDGDALGSLVAMHGVLLALGKDSVMFMDADEFPLPYEYRFFDLDGLQSRRCPPTSTSARSSSSTAATSTATRSRRSSATRPTSSTSTTTTTTRASARSTTWSRTPRAPRRSCGTSCARSASQPDARDRRGALRRPGHRHRQFMYENTGVRAHVMAAELIDAGRRRPRRSTAASTRACPTPKLELLARALARSCSATTAAR